MISTSTKSTLQPYDKVSSSAGVSSALPRAWILLASLLLVSCLVLVLWTFRDYGIGWDESWQATYGDYIIKWYSTGFRDHQALDFRDLQFYGGFYDVIAQLATRISPLGTFETRHFVNALFALIGLFAAFKLGEYLAGPLAGLLSTLFLLLTPRFYGHAFINPKDIPFAVLYLLSTYFIIESVGFLPKVPRGLILKLGISIGLTLGVRVGGVVLLGYLALAFGMWAVAQSAGEEGHSSGIPNFKATLITLGRTYLLICAIAYVTMLVWWPAAQVQPVLNPLKALWKTSHFRWSREIFFEARMVPATEIPWYYVPKWFLITLPEFYFVSLGAGLVLALLGIRLTKRICNYNGLVEYAVLVLSILFPVAYGAIAGPILYDAERHFLFVVPPLAVLGAVSAATLIEWAKPRVLGWMFVSAVLVSMLATVVEMVQLHPYEYVYFNRLFGHGLKEAAKSFDTDYWGLSYKEGAEWIAKNYVGKLGDPKINVASCSFPLSTGYFLSRNRFTYIGSYDYPRDMTSHPNLFLATTRWHCDQTLNGRIVHVVMREGAPLLYVKEVETWAQARRPY